MSDRIDMNISELSQLARLSDYYLDAISPLELQENQQEQSKSSDTHPPPIVIIAPSQPSSESSHVSGTLPDNFVGPSRVANFNWSLEDDCNDDDDGDQLPKGSIEAETSFGL